MESSNTTPGLSWALDLDGDRRDELIHCWMRGDRLTPGPISSLVFSDDDGRVIDQTNYDGMVLRPQALDITGDSAPELLVPLLRHDSLFVSVASISSARGEKLFSFFLIAGVPRMEPDGQLPWDPQVLESWVRDSGHGGNRELVTLVTTNYARLPRGVVVHDLPSGALLEQAIVGGPPQSWLMDDFDGDGDPELLVATLESRHGARAGGFDDAHGYLILFGMSPGLHVAWWSEAGDLGGSPALGRVGAGPERGRILVAWGGGPLVADIIEPGTWTTRVHRTLEGGFTTPLLVDLDRDENPEIVATSFLAPEVVVVDDDLATVRHVHLPIPLGYGRALADADGDGLPEIVFSAGNGSALLDTSLHIKALLPRGDIIGVQRRGPARPARLLIRDGNAMLYATLAPNRWYLVFRYGLPALVVVSLLSGGFLAMWYRRARYRSALLRAAGTEALDAGGRGLLVVDGQGGVAWCSAGLHPEVRRRTLSRNLDAIRGTAPGLADFCAGLNDGTPPRPRHGQVPLGVAGGGGEASVVAYPMLIGSSRDPHWVVRTEKDPGFEGSPPSPAWPLMVQRVTHALKNPLTHMLLTIQRLQAEYRERAPAVAGRLDPYAERIQDGIGQLRRLTSSFLKLVDVDAPELAETDLNGLVARLCERFGAQMPPDIRLRFDLDPGLPTIRADGEQIEVALDNLLTNAVNALDSGGTITVSTGLARRVSDGGNGVARNEVVLEVLDTGHGVPPEVRDLIFNAGFSTAPDGSGLGLAIVRKIARDHGGDVTVESERGVGTGFQVHLPVEGSLTKLDRPRDI